MFTALFNNPDEIKALPDDWTILTSTIQNHLFKTLLLVYRLSRSLWYYCTFVVLGVFSFNTGENWYWRRRRGDLCPQSGIFKMNEWISLHYCAIIASQSFYYLSVNEDSQWLKSTSPLPPQTKMVQSKDTSTDTRWRCFLSFDRSVFTSRYAELS